MTAALAGVLFAWLCLFQGAYGVANLGPEVRDPANFLPPRILVGADVTTSIKPSRPQTLDRQATASGIPDFLSRDPLGEKESLNLYQYTGGDPINYVDVNGLAKVPINQADKQLIELALRYGLINDNAGDGDVIDTAVLNSLLTANGNSPVILLGGNTVVPCVTCHGGSSGGHIDGVSRLFSQVGGQTYSSSGNGDMMRKIGAGAWGNTRALPGDIGNMIAMMANGSANAVGELVGVEIGSHPAFHQSPFDADGSRAAGQQQVYPGISGNDLLVTSGGVLADAVFMFAGPEAIAAKAPGWSVKLAPRFNPANFAGDVARIRAESVMRHGLDFPGAERTMMMADDFWQKGNRVVSLDRLRPPPTKLFADPDKLWRHGVFDQSKYTPIFVDELPDGTLEIMEGMTRIENARRAGMTQLPAFVYPRR